MPGAGRAVVDPRCDKSQLAAPRRLPPRCRSSRHAVVETTIRDIITGTAWRVGSYGDDPRNG